MWTHDHSTLTKVQEAVDRERQVGNFEEMLTEIMRIALESDVQFGSIQIVDSFHSIVNVNTSKDENRKIKAEGPAIHWGSFD